jgi:alcohol dehydrogenase (cytochrome c)
LPSTRRPAGRSGSTAHANSADARVCCGANNRGVAILGDTLFMGTLDAHLVAVDRITGRSLWDVAVGDPKLGYSITMAPLVVKDKVLVGSGGGEYGIRGFIAAFDAKTGKELWRLHTIPGPGETGNDTWGGDSWRTGGGSIWLTPTYDPELNLTYWGVGNPGPDWNPDQRPGDNLYTDSVIAVDPDSRRAEVALPVHAERSIRLRLGADWRARRSHLARDADES